MFSLAQYGSDSDDEVTRIKPLPKQSPEIVKHVPRPIDDVIIESVGNVGVNNSKKQDLQSSPVQTTTPTCQTTNKSKSKKKKTVSEKANLLKQLSEHSLFAVNNSSNQEKENQKERFIDDENESDEDDYYTQMIPPQVDDVEPTTKKTKLYIPGQDVGESPEIEQDDFNHVEDESIYNNLVDYEEDQEDNPTSSTIPMEVLEEMKRQGIAVDSLGGVEIVNVDEIGSSAMVNLEAARRRALMEKHQREIYMTKEEQDALKQFNFTTEGAGNKNRVKVARQKNQISFLAQQSSGKELEMAERLEKARSSNKTAKRKYGW